MQSIESIETYVYGTSKDLICKKETVLDFSQGTVKLFLFYFLL